jgi:phosphatidylglycerophosphatase A
MKNLFKPSTIISTCLWVGKIPFAPGTFGTLLGAVYIWFIFMFPRMTMATDLSVLLSDIFGSKIIIDQSFIFPALIINTILLTIIGTICADRYSKFSGSPDPKEVVIDEFIGILLAFLIVAGVYALLINHNPEYYYARLPLASYFNFPLSGVLIPLFVLFRFYDIVKPSLVGWADKNIKGGLGIMMDDIIAGIFAAITYLVIFFALDYFGIFENLINSNI